MNFQLSRPRHFELPMWVDSLDDKFVNTCFSKSASTQGLRAADLFRLLKIKTGKHRFPDQEQSI
jgi:hypothetical protein